MTNKCRDSRLPRKSCSLNQTTIWIHNRFVHSNLLEKELGDDDGGFSSSKGIRELICSSGDRSSKGATPETALFPYLGLEARARSPNILCSIEKVLSPRVAIKGEEAKGEEPDIPGEKLLKDRVSIKGFPSVKMLQAKITRTTIDKNPDIFVVFFKYCSLICR